MWIDVEQEGSSRPTAAVPNLARRLLDVLPATDGGARLGAAPAIVTEDDVPDLVAALSSQQRRGPVFVAGSSEILPLTRWTEYVGKLLHDTVGLAAGYVLNPGATEALRESLGPRHAVIAGTLRTYLPGIEPASELDALRHRFLTTDTIIRTPDRRIRHTLGARAREIALSEGAPRWAARTETRLLEATDTRVLEWRPTVLVDAHPSADGGAPLAGSAVTEPEVVVLVEEHEPRASTDGERDAAPIDTPVIAVAASAGTVHSETGLPALAQDLFGAALDADLLRALARDREASIAAQAELLTLGDVTRRALHRTDQLSARVLVLEEDLQRSRHAVDDAQADLALSGEEVALLERTVTELRRRLMEVGRHDDAWALIPEAEGKDVSPGTFAELLDRLKSASLAHVVFTGNDDHSESLDVTWPLGPPKAWSALLALEGYALAKANGLATAGVDHYLRNTPGGYACFSAARHAHDESEEVKSNPKFFEPRMLHVPAAVNPAERVFMGAHFKLAQLGQVSPRLHYYDATAIDGRVYVGYLGVHLPTGKTN
ncbi:hypothetical protein [Salana multivorans]